MLKTLLDNVNYILTLLGCSGWLNVVFSIFLHKMITIVQSSRYEVFDIMFMHLYK